MLGKPTRYDYPFYDTIPFEMGDSKIIHGR